MVTNNGASAGLVGLSTDTKPEAEINTLFLELDTGDFYYYTGDSETPWAKVGGDA